MSVLNLDCQPTVGILLAYFNGDRFIKKQIYSILGQSYKNFCIHIFDDASNDYCRRYLEEIQKKYPKKIKIHRRKKNVGFSKNFLMGVKQIPKYDFYAFADQDDVWKKTKLSSYLKIFEIANGKLNLIGSSSTLIDERGKVLGKGKKIPKTISIKEILVQNPCGGNTMMFTHNIRLLLKKLKVDVPYHDWITIILASIQNSEIALLPTASIYYRIHGNNLVGNIGGIKILFRKLFYVFSGQYKKDLQINLRAIQSVNSQCSYETAEVLRDFDMFLNGNFRHRFLQFYKNRFWSPSYLIRASLLITVFKN